MTNHFIELLLLLTLAVALVWLFRLLKLPAILAYLMAGMIAGPHAMGWIAQPDDYSFVAEIGVVFLLFSLGLEFSLAKMIAMRKLVFGLGAAQVLLTSLLLTGLAYWLLEDLASAIVLASLLALSSTAVVIKQLAETAQLTSRKGQITVAILLFQDIAVVPLLIVIPLLAQPATEYSMTWQLSVALGKGTLVVIALLAMGKWLLPRLFKEIAKQRTDELFVLATLLVTLLAGGLTHLFGLSMALGAFVAGMMLGESKYKHQLEADIRPFRDILMGLFFITVGMALNIPEFIARWYWVLAIVALVGLLKGAIVYGMARWLGERKTDSFASAMMLFQIGEFGFVLVALALSQGIVDEQTTALVVGAGVLGMALTPLVIQRSQRWCQRLFAGQEQTDLVQQLPQQPDHHSAVVLFGYGRVGQTISRFLTAEGIDYLAIDHDPKRVQEAIAGGANVFYGDARRRDLLRGLAIDQAELVVISFADDEAAEAIIEAVRECNHHCEIVVRSRDDLRLTQLMAAGATQVVPDTLEASLMLVSQVLSRRGVALRKILQRLDHARRSHYGELHGFYPGDTTLLSAETADTLLFLHAVSLPCEAYAIGKSLSQLALDDLAVTVRAVRRDGQERSELDGDFEFACDDVVILAGRPHAIEAAEGYLLNG